MEGIDKNARLIKENFSTFSVCATGGMDSRITLAALIQKKLRPRLVYWVGDSIMTGTESQDEKIVTEISKIMNLEKKIVKAPTVSYPDNAGYMETSLKKYGELYHIFGCNKYIFAMYEDENIIGDFHDFGVGTNWLKSCEQAAFPMFQEEFGGDLELTVERVIKKIYFRSEVEQALGDEYEDFYEMVKDEVMTFLEKNHIKNKKLSRENVSLLSLEYFKRANSFNYNMANYYTYSFPVAVTKEISKIIADTDYSFRENNHLVVDLFVHICQSEKALLGIPFYSDIKIQKVDFDKKTMYEPKKILFRKKIVEMKRFLIKGQIYEILRKMYHNLTNKKQGDEYDAIDYWTSPLKEYLNKSDIYCKFDLSEFQKNAHFSSVIDIFFMVWATEYYRSDHFIDKHSEIKGGNCK